MNRWIKICIVALSLNAASAFAATAGMDMSGVPMDKGIQPKTVTHQGNGKVAEVNVARSSVKLSHEAIKSLGWAAMTMSFNVVNVALLQGLKAGDAVTFELSQGSKPGSWVITRITPPSKYASSGAVI